MSTHNLEIRARFGHHLDPSRRALADRYCFLDYDREFAMVAEAGQDDHGELVGVGRLVAGADRRTAELAVLVVDAWQNKGLGSRLTDSHVQPEPNSDVADSLNFSLNCSNDPNCRSRKGMPD